MKISLPTGLLLVHTSMLQVIDHRIDPRAFAFVVGWLPKPSRRTPLRMTMLKSYFNSFGFAQNWAFDSRVRDPTDDPQPPDVTRRQVPGSCRPGKAFRIEEFDRRSAISCHSAAITSRSTA